MFISRAHYSSDAFLMDPELREVVLQLLKGMSGFQLQYDYTSALLNVWQPSSLELAGLSSKNILYVAAVYSLSLYMCVILSDNWQDKLSHML